MANRFTKAKELGLPIPKGTNQYSKAKELGLPKPLLSEETLMKMSKSNQKPHTEETKKKMSASRIKFLNENPDMVPYKLNHYSKGRSYAEEYWKVVLDSNDVIYEEQYRIGLYSLDFAITDKFIDFEIDGDQHYTDPRIVESDKRRNEYLINLGWRVIRIKWSEFKKLNNKKDYVDFIINELKN